MQIKLMLLLLSFLIGDRLIDSGGSRPSDKEGGRGGLVIQTLRYGGGGGGRPGPSPGSATDRGPLNRSLTV